MLGTSIRICTFYQILLKVKQSHYRSGQAQRVLRKLRFPYFVTTAQVVVRFSALRTRLLCPQEILLIFISVKRLSRPQGHSAIGRILCQKNSLTPAGIEPATFRFVAQRLNHCATAVLPSTITALKMKESEVDGACSVHGSNGKCICTYVQKFRSVF